MTEKTFYSATTPETRKITVSTTGEGNVHLAISGDCTAGIQLEPATMPAIMLALAEAAYPGDGKNRAPHRVGEAWAALYSHIAEMERATAEAEEQAKLEAEAVELENAGRDAAGADRIEELSEMGRTGREFILAVARKAREIRAEK